MKKLWGDTCDVRNSEMKQVLKDRKNEKEKSVKIK